MAVDIELFGQLLPGSPRCQLLNLENPQTVRQIAILLGMDPEDVGLIAINGRQSELEDIVPNGCRLCFFPPMSGG